MLRTSSRLFFSLLFLCVANYSLHAQRPGMGGSRGGGGTINVQVRYADGRPGPRGIHVRLEHAEGGAEADLETVAGGKCVFQQSTSGVFVVRITESNYKEVSARVELIHSPTAYVTLDLIPLNKEPDPELVVPPANSPEAVSVADLGVPEQAHLEFTKGEDALRDKNAEESVKHFQKAIKLYETYPQAYRMLGEAYLQQKDLTKAQDSFKKSIELDPKAAASYIDLGALLNQTHDYPGAETALKKSLELSPDAAGAKYELAKTYWAMNRWQDAAPLAEQAVKALPEMASAHVLLANIRLKQRDAAGALHEYQEYLRLEPDGAMAPQVREMVEKLQKALAH
jgi:cytochrome c-type biogenesis protein CcmH/NrfG